jgi:uncharacterized protein YbjT (DUF2867 family)
MSTYLVLGGTGKVGRRVVDRLRTAGHVARAASRHGEWPLDVLRADTWGPALVDVEGVLLVGPGSTTDYVPLMGEFVQRAHGAGVKRVVLLSARGAEFHPGGIVARAERAVAAGPLPWTILRATWFAQNFTEGFFAPQGDVISAPTGDGREPFVDVDDLAAVAAVALRSDRFAGETLGVSGPGALTFAQAAAALSGPAGRELTFVAADPHDYARSLVEGGFSAQYVAWRMAMLDAIRAGRDAHLSDGVSRVLGRPATPFGDFAARDGHLIGRAPQLLTPPTRGTRASGVARGDDAPGAARGPADPGRPGSARGTRGSHEAGSVRLNSRHLSGEESRLRLDRTASVAHTGEAMVAACAGMAGRGT